MPVFEWGVLAAAWFASPTRQLPNSASTSFANLSVRKEKSTRKNKTPKTLILTIASVLVGLSVSIFLTPPYAFAQNQQMQQQMAELKESTALNKQILAKYTWQEQQTIGINGEVKKQQQFLVRIGPDGKPQKSEIDPQDQSSSGRQHGLKHRVVEKKKEEYADYAEQIGALAQQYARPDPLRLQQLFQQGNILIGSPWAPGLVKFVIQGYLKPGDSLTLVLGEAQKALVSVQVSSYLDTPQDAMTLSAQFVQKPGGPNHVSSMVVNGMSNQLTIATQNSNYQPM